MEILADVMMGTTPPTDTDADEDLDGESTLRHHHHHPRPTIGTETDDAVPRKSGKLKADRQNRYYCWCC